MHTQPTSLRILTTLTWELRTASEGQLARGLQLSLPEVQACCRALRKRKLLDAWRTSVPVHDLVGPLVLGARDSKTPDFGSIAWQLRKRWEQSSRRVQRMLWANTAAVNLVGGVGGKLRQPLQLDHDLGVAEIWACRHNEPTLQWISEDIYRSWFVRSAKDKVPDALLIDPDGNVVKRVLEYGGQYSRRRLEAFHRYWSTRAPYEIW
jgi:hypothetical protein